MSAFSRRFILAVTGVSLATIAVACGKDDSDTSADDDLRDHFGEKEVEFIDGGTDSEHDIDPVRDDPEIFSSALVTQLYAWKPREMSSAYDIRDVTRNLLTGSLRDRYLDADSDAARAATPKEWIDLAVDGVTFSVIVTDEKIIQEQANNAKTVRVLFQQFKTRNTQRTLFAECSADVSLVNTSGHWRAQDLVVKSLD